MSKYELRVEWNKDKFRWEWKIVDKVNENVIDSWHFYNWKDIDTVIEKNRVLLEV